MQVKIKCFADEEIAIIKDGKKVSSNNVVVQGKGMMSGEQHEPHEEWGGEQESDMGNGEGRQCEKMIIKRIAPDKFLLLKVGKIKYSQDGKGGEFDLTEDDIKKLIEEFNQRKKDLVMDYEHGTLDNQAAYKGDAPAAGWISGLEMTPEGLVANVKNWSDKARKLLENGEYRYHSPVIIFDDETNKPIGIQSVALTNHPAIHDIPALVAANDTGKSTIMADEDKVSIFNKFKNLLTEIKGGAESLGDLLDSTMKDVSEFVKGDEKLESELKAFNDSVFANVNIKSFADDNAMAVMEAPSEDGNMVGEKRDIWNLITENREKMNGATLLDWINSEMSKTNQRDEKLILEAERKRLLEFKDKHPDLWEKGLTSANPYVQDYIIKNEQAKNNMIYMSDIKTFVGLKAETKEDITVELKAMSDKVKTASMYLKMNDVKSFEELDNKIKKERDVLSKELNDAKEVILMNDINKEIDIAINEGKLVEGSRLSAVALAKADRKALTDFIKHQPVMVGSFKNLIADESAKPFSDVAQKKQFVSNVQAQAVKALLGEDASSEQVNWNLKF